MSAFGYIFMLTDCFKMHFCIRVGSRLLKISVYVTMILYVVVIKRREFVVFMETLKRVFLVEEARSFQTTTTIPMNYSPVGILLLKSSVPQSRAPSRLSKFSRHRLYILSPQFLVFCFSFGHFLISFNPFAVI